MGFQFAETMRVDRDRHSEFLAPPRPDTFFARANITDVQKVLEIFHSDRPYMTDNHNNISSLLNFLNGEVQEVLRDWTPSEKMSRESYKNQEISDCSIFLLTIAEQLDLVVPQEALESFAQETFRQQPKYVSKESWTRHHEGLYWSLLGTLSWRVQRLRQTTFPKTFDALSDQQWQAFSQEVMRCLEITWTLHRLHGRNPNQEMLDKIARNQAKYVAGMSRNESKKFYLDRDMNTEHFSQENQPVAPAVLGEPGMFSRVQSVVRSRVARQWSLR